MHSRAVLPQAAGEGRKKAGGGAFEPGVQSRRLLCAAETKSATGAAAQALLDARYGYAKHLIPVGPAFTTLVADVGGEIVATVTLELRAGAAWLVRLASSGRSASVLTELFWLAYEHGTAKSAARDLYIHVHPRHVGFYRSALSFGRLERSKAPRRQSPAS